MATMRIEGDLHIPAATIKVVGSRALSIQVSDDVSIDPGAVFDLSASGSQPGPGGGQGGGALSGGAGATQVGQGGARGAGGWRRGRG